MAAKRKEDPPPAGAPAWMATFSDLTTLLLCFFVMLFASSTIDAEKLQAIASSFNNMSILNGGQSIYLDSSMGSGVAQLPNISDSVLDGNISDYESQDDREREEMEQELAQMASDFQTYFAENNLSEYLEVENTGEYIKINFEDDSVLFDLGSAEIKDEALPILDKITELLMKYPNNDIKVEGHTDNLPIRTARYNSNWELSAARAISVALFFIEEKDFSPMRMSTEGFGEYRPIADNDTPEGRAKNRRVEIKVYSTYNSRITLQ